MPTDIKAPNVQPAVIAYARLLTDMHRLTAEGKGDSEEAEALADRMDAPWYAMTRQEQDRARGLAADLNALREGGPRRMDMSPEQLADWQCAAKEAYTRGEYGDVDATLAFLRRPVPSSLPPEIVPFLQARCWEKLGDLETALLFMKEADRLDPEQALSVLLLLQQLGREDQSKQYADRVIDNPSSPSLELYLAGVALLRSTRQMSDVEAKPILQRVVSVLERALSQYLALSPEQKAEAPSDVDADIAQALGLALERLGERKSAIEVYTGAIGRHPRDGELLMARGLALYEADLPRALTDLMQAARSDVAAIWPYLLLARHALQRGIPREALRLALAAERQPGPPAGRAEVYETIAVALAELGQPKERVLENFDIALALDPKNDRIRENRVLAAALTPQSRTGRAGHPRLRQAPPIQGDVFRQDRSDQINNRTELLNEQRRKRVSSGLVEV